MVSAVGAEQDKSVSSTVATGIIVKPVYLF